MVSYIHKIGYAFAEAGIFAIEFMLRLELLKFYQEKVGLPAYLVGLAVAFGLIWDALSDPIMGYISDHTKSRWGNRRPYLFAGGFLLPITIVILFHPPNFSNPIIGFLYLLLSYLGLNTALTILAVPHAALSGEIAFSAKERTFVFVIRFVFGNLGLLLSLYLLTRFNPIYASRWIAVLVFISAILAFLAVSKVESIPLQGKKNFFLAIKDFFKSLNQVLKNGYFRPLLLAYVVAYVGIAMNSALARYYYEYFLAFDREKTGIVLLLFLFVWTLSLPFWYALSKKYGKKIPGFLGVFLLGVMTTFGYPFFPEGELFWPVGAAFVGGILVGSVVLLDSLVADVVDYDELKSKEHREGLYFGFWKMAIKLSRALALFLGGLALSFLGFDGVSGEIPVALRYKIGLLFGPGVGLFFILGALIFLYMPLTSKEHARIQSLLIKRRALIAQREGRAACR